MRSHLLALFLAGLICPGTGELVVDALHLLETGHTEHAHDVPVDAEHGCSGPFHVCGCHSTVPFACEAAPAVAEAPEMSVAFVVTRDPEGSPGHARSLYRPPSV